MYCNLSADNFNPSDYSVNISEISYQFQKDSSSNNPSLYFKMPVLDNWNVTFDFNIITRLHKKNPKKYNVELILKDIDISTAITLSSDSDGQLTPIIRQLQYTVGNYQLLIPNHKMMQWFMK